MDSESKASNTPLTTTDDQQFLSFVKRCMTFKEQPAFEMCQASEFEYHNPGLGKEIAKLGVPVFAWDKKTLSVSFKDSPSRTWSYDRRQSIWIEDNIKGRIKSTIQLPSFILRGTYTKRSTTIDATLKTNEQSNSDAHGVPGGVVFSKTVWACKRHLQQFWIMKEVKY